MRVPILLTALAFCLSPLSPTSATAASVLKDASTFDEYPADPDSIDAQLMRYKGQTKFLNPESSWYPYRDGRFSEDSQEAGAGRDIQESDIYKLGKEGSKLLFLLNNYRGLQVVSFADGPDQPKLVGRANPTGNWPDDMYYDAASDKIFVLERVWSDSQGWYSAAASSRLLTYDVSVPENPRLIETVEIEGSLADSRLVGDVFYIATRISDSSSSTSQGQGKIYSYNIRGDSIQEIDTYTLTLPITALENMNILQVEQGGGFKYYLIATLSESQWGWWDSQSTVEVVDITDPSGQIDPLMVAETRGFLRERSQTTIRDGVLIATTNYTPEESENLRIAVESFRFPDGDDDTLSTDEAEYRRLHIEREIRERRRELIAEGVSGDALETALNEYREGLLHDPELGLAGQFVAVNETLRKIRADAVTTVGSTQDLSASLQDVRYQGDLLYAFWVPQNNIDPLDVFDISQPVEAIPHLAHLEFDGWIQHATPLSWQGEDYLLGLGWVIPAVDNENQRRFPQATLIKLRDAEGDLNPEVMSTWRMPNSGVWANFNAADKFIDVRMEDDGTGDVLFAFSSWSSQNYNSGGLLLGFNLNAPATAFDQGAILQADESWLRRVFRFKEIDRLHSFSDMALGTFDVDDIGEADLLVQAAHVLELARDIVRYVTVSVGDKLYGVQIISDASWSQPNRSATQLRLVDTTKADAEKAAVIGQVDLPGSYVNHVDVATNSMIILTRRYLLTVDDDDNWQYAVHYFLSRVDLASDHSLQNVGQVTWQDEQSSSGLTFTGGLLQTADGHILIAQGNQLQRVALTEGTLNLEQVTLQNCDFGAATVASLKNLEAGLYATYEEPVADAARPELRLSRHHLGKVSITDSTFSCSPAVNVPGSVLSFDGTKLVTNDDRTIDIRLRGETAEDRYYQVTTEKALSSLNVAAETASLKDLYDPDDVSIQRMHIVDDAIVFVENHSTSYWAMRSDIIWPREPRAVTEHRYVSLTVDDEGDFVRSISVLDLGIEGAANLLKVFADGSYAAVGTSTKLQVLKLTAGERPEPIEVRRVLPNGTMGDPEEVIKLHSHFWYWSGESENIHYTPSLKSLEVAEGLFGVTQIYLP